MNKTFILFSLLILLASSLQVRAIPARNKVMTLRQPDGTEVRVIVSGDEFYKMTRTEDGAAVTLEDDGYWYYAYYDINGAKRNSGVRVGAKNGAAAAAAAHNIPYGMLRSRAAALRAEAGRQRAENIRRLSPATKAGIPVNKAIIVLAEFQNLTFKYTRDNFVDMLTKPGYSYAGAEGCALDYFRDQFEGAADFEFVVSPIVTLSQDFQYYGKNGKDGFDAKAHEAVAEACRLADDAIDFSQFDGNGDGMVDNVFVFVAGHDEAQGATSDHIWSHQWYLISGGINLRLDGVKLNSYAISTELSREDGTWKEIFTTIGTFCHEYSHALGLSDLYDTDYNDSGGEFNAVWGTTSLMDHGNYNNNGNTPPNYNSFELWSLGLGRAEEFSIGPQTLAPLSAQKRYFIAETDVEDELYFFECRTPEGWDKYVGGSGMLIYHYDASSNDAGYSDDEKRNLTAKERWWYNQVNCNPDHPCFDLVEAVPIATNISHVFWPNGTHTEFNASSNPPMVFWSGGQSPDGIADIKKDGTFVTFTITGPITIDSVEEFQDAAIVMWSIIAAGEDTESVISIKPAGGSATEHRVKPYKKGNYSYTFEGLSPDMTYTVSVFTPDRPENFVSTEFTTKKYYTDGYPFIYLNSADRNSDGSFKAGSKMPLRVFNARGAARVSWTYSDNVLSTDGSGYYTVKGSGTIKATVDYEDGTTDIITKQITVK